MGRQRDLVLRSKFLLGVLVLIILCPCPTFSEENATEAFSGLLVRIFDGNTVSVQRGEERVKVKLAGIDAPERQQAFGQESRWFVKQHAALKTVQVIPYRYDDKKQLIADVIMPGGESLAAIIVKNGFAWRLPNNEDPKLVHLENEAWQNRLGLWAVSKPVPPWEWREIRPFAMAKKMIAEGRIKPDSEPPKQFFLNFMRNVKTRTK